jgi:hypothetical protein
MSTARVYNRRPVAHRTPRQLAWRRRIEGLIGVAAPALDLLLFAGDRASRIAGRNDVDPEPPHLRGRATRTPIGGAPGREESG